MPLPFEVTIDIDPGQEWYSDPFTVSVGQKVHVYGSGTVRFYLGIVDGHRFDRLRGPRPGNLQRGPFPFQFGSDRSEWDVWYVSPASGDYVVVARLGVFNSAGRIRVGAEYSTGWRRVPLDVYIGVKLMEQKPALSMTWPAISLMFDLVGLAIDFVGWAVHTLGLAVIGFAVSVLGFAIGYFAVPDLAGPLRCFSQLSTALGGVSTILSMSGLASDLPHG